MGLEALCPGRLLLTDTIAGAVSHSVRPMPPTRGWSVESSGERGRPPGRGARRRRVGAQWRCTIAISRERTAGGRMERKDDVFSAGGRTSADGRTRSTHFGEAFRGLPSSSIKNLLSLSPSPPPLLSSSARQPRDFAPLLRRKRKKRWLTTDGSLPGGGSGHYQTGSSRCGHSGAGMIPAARRSARGTSPRLICPPLPGRLSRRGKRPSLSIPGANVAHTSSAAATPHSWQ